MCGIAGIYSPEGRVGIDDAVLSKMTDALKHRGPDDVGYHIEERLGFGFRRLSIIDLYTGNQPMYNEDKSLVSMCNGEIFNYKELKDYLLSRGHIFYTSCDSEVLVHLYEECGTEFLSRLNGQFAFALYDRRRKVLLLARDQTGITPLFYTLIKGVLLFASEIKSILEHPLVKREVDLTGLDQVFSFPGLVSPVTMFKGINSLKPGHYLIYKEETPEVREYWDLVYPEESEERNIRPESFYVEKLEELLLKSVGYRLLADVPVGFYLSGGLDSSLIAALIKTLSPGTRRHSFSIGFRDRRIDEREFQKIMAEHVESIPSETEFDWKDIRERFHSMILHTECPVKESYNTCSLALSESVRKNSIKVILTGEGSDELFAGYVGYRFDRQRKYFDSDVSDLERMLEDEEREKLWGDSNFMYEKNQYAFRETKLALYSEGVGEVFHEFDSVNENLIDKSKLRNRHYIHKRSYLDFKLRLADHLLGDHGDRMAYANSIEARFPFLDIDLLNFVTEIPPDLKLKGLVEKYILKKVSEKYLPHKIVNREKFGFVAPGSPYLIKQDIRWLNDILSYERIKRGGYFNPDTVERLKKIYSADGFMLDLPFDSDLLMIVISFHLFLEIFDMPGF